MDIKIGEYAKFIDASKVFKVCGLTKGSQTIPDGWLIDKDGCATNPKFCERYDGSLSAICDAERHINRPTTGPTTEQGEEL